MKPKKLIFYIFILMITRILTACGGSSEDTVNPAVPTVPGQPLTAIKPKYFDGFLTLSNIPSSTGKRMAWVSGRDSSDTNSQFRIYVRDLSGQVSSTANTLTLSDPVRLLSSSASTILTQELQGLLSPSGEFALVLGQGSSSTAGQLYFANLTGGLPASPQLTSASNLPGTQVSHDSFHFSSDSQLFAYSMNKTYSSTETGETIYIGQSLDGTSQLLAASDLGERYPVFIPAASGYKLLTFKWSSSGYTPVIRTFTSYNTATQATAEEKTSLTHLDISEGFSTPPSATGSVLISQFLTSKAARSAKSAAILDANGQAAGDQVLFPTEDFLVWSETAQSSLSAAELLQTYDISSHTQVSDGLFWTGHTGFQCVAPQDPSNQEQQQDQTSYGAIMAFSSLDGQTKRKMIPRYAAGTTEFKNASPTQVASHPCEAGADQVGELDLTVSGITATPDSTNTAFKIGYTSLKTGDPELWILVEENSGVGFLNVSNNPIP